MQNTKKIYFRGNILTLSVQPTLSASLQLATTCICKVSKEIIKCFYARLLLQIIQMCICFVSLLSLLLHKWPILKSACVLMADSIKEHYLALLVSLSFLLQKENMIHIFFSIAQLFSMKAYHYHLMDATISVRCVFAQLIF